MCVYIERELRYLTERLALGEIDIDRLLVV